MGVLGRGARGFLAGGLVLLSVLFAPQARAELFQAAGGGAFIGYSFGERGGFEWGLEGFAGWPGFCDFSSAF